MENEKQFDRSQISKQVPSHSPTCLRYTRIIIKLRARNHCRGQRACPEAWTTAHQYSNFGSAIRRAWNAVTPVARSCSSRTMPYSLWNKCSITLTKKFCARILGVSVVIIITQYQLCNEYNRTSYRFWYHGWIVYIWPHSRCYSRQTDLSSEHEDAKVFTLFTAEYYSTTWHFGRLNRYWDTHLRQLSLTVDISQIGNIHLRPAQHARWS